MPKTVTVIGKQQAKVALNAVNIASVGALGTDVSTISDEALAKYVSAELAKTWVKENELAIAERHAWIYTHGAPLADFQTLKID